MRTTPYGLVQQQEDEPTDRHSASPTPPTVPADRDIARVAIVMGMLSGLFSVLIIAFIVLRSP